MSTLVEPFGRITALEKDQKSLYFEDVKVLEGHTSSVFTCEYFGPPHHKIITGSWDGSIRIWDCDTFECLGMQKTLGCHINSISVFTEDTFLCCGGYIFCFSILPPKFERVKYITPSSPARGEGWLRMTILNEDLIACSNGKSEVVIISYSNELALKRFFIGCIHGDKMFAVKSRAYPNTFYVPTRDETQINEVVKLIDYERDLVTKEFEVDSSLMYYHYLPEPVSEAKYNETNWTNFALTLLKNSREEEILIVCDNAQNFIFFDTSNQPFTKNKKIVQLSPVTPGSSFEEARLAWKGYDFVHDYPGDKIMSCFSCLDDRYLCCGGAHGQVVLYEVSETENCQKIRIKKLTEKVKLRSAYVSQVTCFLKSIESGVLGDSCVWLYVVCSDDFYVARVSKLIPIRKEGRFENSDREERMEFLMKKFYFEEYMEGSLFRVLLPSQEFGSGPVVVTVSRFFLL